MLHVNLNRKNKKFFYFTIFTIIVSAIVAFIYRDAIRAVYSDPILLREFILGLGAWGPLFLISIQAIQVLILIIPGPVFTVAGGYVFGTFWGTVYSLIGTVIGSVLIFLIGHKFGRPLIKAVINEHELNHFDVLFKKKGNTALVISRTAPLIFPNDAVSLAASLTKMSLKDYTVLSFVGFIPNILLLTIFGDQIGSGQTPTVLIYFSLMSIFALVYLFRRQIRGAILKDVREFEHKLKH
jgi:uncharacterized membrane protein YdjX (TVP38/TMEM64 family)